MGFFPWRKFGLKKAVWRVTPWYTMEKRHHGNRKRHHGRVKVTPWPGWKSGVCVSLPTPISRNHPLNPLLKVVLGWQIGFLRVIPPSVSFLEICLSFLQYEIVIPSKNTCHSPYLRACHSAENFWPMCHSLETNVSFLLSFYETYSVILVIPRWPMCHSLPTNVSFLIDQCVIPLIPKCPFQKMCHSFIPECHTCHSC